MQLEIIQIIQFGDKEAATGGVLWTKALLKISQNSQKNTCARVFFLIKLQILKRYSNIGVFILF